MNIPWWIPAAGAALATAILSWLLHSASIHRLEAQHEVELNKQADAIRDNFKTINSVAEARANDYQKKSNDLAGELRAIKLRQPARCIAVRPAATPANPATAPSMGPGSGNGLRSEWLTDYSGKCKQQVIDFNLCQGFLEDLYKLNGAAK